MKKVDKKRLVKTLQGLVKIPSIENSIAVSLWVKNKMEGFGFKIDSGRDGNLIAETGKGPGFILNAHLDTVSPGRGWEHDPFGGIVENGRIYGIGASDCKAGVAAMMEIARILKKEKLNKRIVFTFTAFEEESPLEKNGVHSILPKLKNIDKGIILEPTTQGNAIGIAVGCRGTTRCHLEILGKRGHSAYPHRYDNPIYKFPSFMEELKKFPISNMEIGMTGEEIEDGVTVTEICAKEGINVIPAKCKLSIDRRALPDEEPMEFFGRLNSICKKSFGNNFKVKQKTGIQGYLFEDRKFLKLCKGAINSVKCRSRPYFARGRTDSCILYNFAKIGTFVIGPGNMSLAHKKDEYCEINNLYRTTKVVLEVIKRWDGL